MCAMISTLLLLALPVLAAPKQVVVHLTAKDGGQRLARTETAAFKTLAQPLETQPTVFVDPAKSFQTFLGIGGALTDSAAEVFAALPADKRAELLKAYWDPKEGIGYSLARTNIHSCDFSSESYTYVKDGDAALDSFSIEHDRKYRIPFLKQATRAAGGQLRLFVSPWSPPAWMKDSGSMLQGGKLKPEFRPAWARYFAKFIKAYEAEGLPIWGLTAQNEPMAKQKWESAIYTAEEERDFIRDHLGPMLAKEGLGSRKIIAWDHNRDLLYQRAQVILSDPAAAKYVWGIGFHWYEDWVGTPQLYRNLKHASEAFPKTNFLGTEACNCPFDMSKINEWKWGESYGRAMMHDFNNGAVGWTDWNVILDERGGPNHVGNFCFAPVHGDLKNGTLIYTNAYHYIGHFSKFIRPGAKRVSAVSTRDPLLTTAFRNQDGTLAVVVMNQSDTPYDYLLWLDGQAAELKSPARSIATLIVD